MPAWTIGSQLGIQNTISEFYSSLVALNFQTEDSPMWLNDAHFADNGGCGTAFLYFSNSRLRP